MLLAFTIIHGGICIAESSVPVTPVYPCVQYTGAIDNPTYVEVCSLTDMPDACATLRNTAPIAQTLLGGWCSVFGEEVKMWWR